MKKFNLLLMATLVAFTSIFTSCKDDEASVLEITLENAAIASGASLNGSITATSGLNMVKVFVVIPYVSENSILEIDKFDILPIIKTTDGQYTILVPPSVLTADGSYKITAIDKDGKEASKSFTVGSGNFTLGTLTSVKTGVNIVSVLADPASGASCCASATGNVFTPNASTQSAIDFVYYNGYPTHPTPASQSPNSTFYSPASAAVMNISTVNNIFSAWSTKNATIFAAVTAKDETSVYTALTTASSTSLSVSSIGDKVAFKTAGNVYGVITVTNLGTPNYGGYDAVTVTVETFQ